MSSNIDCLSKECAVFFDEPLARHTSLKIGGPARYFCVPESTAALIRTVRYFREQAIPFRLLGKGSNVLVGDAGFEGGIISTAGLTGLECHGNQVRAESGVSLQTLIRFGMQHSLGGIEYLQSVPATVGGAIFMNAGRGGYGNRTLGEHVRAVEVYDGETLFWLQSHECQFQYRRSVFHDHPHWQILSAYLEFPFQAPELTQQRVQERMSMTKQTQDAQHPNVGTVFKANYHAFDVLSGYRVGGAMFSTKTPNWIINVNQATAADVLALIDFAVTTHVEKGVPAPILEIDII